ncbi:MAG: hypothetical protein OXB92_16905 [Acidimicrobiaceae bacterium]|nr:hypothetical protein [Acidimicrobiaceae bacterium]
MGSQQRSYKKFLTAEQKYDLWVRMLSGQITQAEAVPPLEVDRPTIDWAESFASEFLEEYGQSVREGLAYAYGIETNDLRRRTSSRRATDCFLRISSTDPSWTIQVRFDRNEVKVENVDVLEWIRIAFRRDAAHNRYAREFGESGFKGGQALSVVATEHSVDVLCRFPVVEFAGHVVEGVSDEREVYGVYVEVGAFG